MTHPVTPEYDSELEFHGPLASSRADKLAARMAATRPKTILDLGCGSAELLLRTVSMSEDALGVGVDHSAPDIDKARRQAHDRGMARQVKLICQSGTDYSQPADVVLCIGASQVFGPIPQALVELRKLVNPGGRLLFGDGFWERAPSETELSHMWNEATRDDHTDLATLVEQAASAGFEPLHVETANRDEWEHFESGYLSTKAKWLLHNPDDSAATKVRDEITRHRNCFLRGYRDILGFAFIELGVASQL